MPDTPETIDDQVREQCELAIIYVEDGAFASAARVLRTIAEKLQTRAEEVHAEIAALNSQEGN